MDFPLVFDFVFVLVLVLDLDLALFGKLLLPSLQLLQDPFL